MATATATAMQFPQFCPVSVRRGGLTAQESAISHPIHAAGEWLPSLGSPP